MYNGVRDLSSCNHIGNEGMRHLSDALARGAAPALETLVVNKAISNLIRESKSWRTMT